MVINFHFKQWKTVLLQLTFIAAGIFVIIRLYQYIHPPEPKQALPNIPDFIVQNPSAIIYDGQGKLIYHVNAQTAEHYASDDHLSFTYPIGYFYSANVPPWKVSADNGIATHDFNEVQLTDNVIFHQQPGRHNKMSTIKTTQVTYYPKTNEAKTDASVMASQPGITVTSQGLYANLAEGKVELLHQAKIYYETS